MFAALARRYDSVFTVNVRISGKTVVISDPILVKGLFSAEASPVGGLGHAGRYQGDIQYSTGAFVRTQLSGRGVVRSGPIRWHHSEVLRLDSVWRGRKPVYRCGVRQYGDGRDLRTLLRQFRSCQRTRRANDATTAAWRSRQGGVAERWFTGVPPRCEERATRRPCRRMLAPNVLWDAPSLDNLMYGHQYVHRRVGRKTWQRRQLSRYGYRRGRGYRR
jgi:hypothetical protein